MPVPVNAILVVVASPADAVEERAVGRDALNDWNIRRGRRQGVVLLTWLYERHAVPAMGERPQALINAQAVDQADVVVAFFDPRLGSSTGVDISGTAEEIHRAMDAGKPVHICFSTEAIPRDADLAQVEALRKFQQELREVGLLGEYADPVDLAGQVDYALQQDIADQGWAAHLASTSRVGAQLRWRHNHAKKQTGIDQRGRVKYRTTANDLVVRNDSDVAAQDLTFVVTPLDEEANIHFEGPEGPITVHPHSEMQWLLISRISGTIVKIEAKWNESEVPRTGDWTVVVG